jgi:hypothetical protein
MLKIHYKRLSLRVDVLGVLLITSIGTTTKADDISSLIVTGSDRTAQSNMTLTSIVGQPFVSLYSSSQLMTGFPIHQNHIAPASCQIYAVNDKGLNNSQFFTITLDENNEINELGPMYKGYDIESIAIHPETNMIYAASGNDVTNGKRGHFYIVDGEKGTLFPVGSTGFNDIEDLAFSPINPDGNSTLYAWAKGEGLITIALTNGAGTLKLPATDIPIEGLTLRKDQGHIFFGAVQTDLWQYDMDAKTLEVICPNKLLGETEALETMSDGLLLVGTHNVPFGLHAFNAQTCEVIMADETLSNKFDDVEGIAVPVAACAK